MKRASDKGLHLRFYYRHHQRIKDEKREQQAKIRRGHPLWGFRANVARYRRGECSFHELFERCGRAFDWLDGKDGDLATDR